MVAADLEEFDRQDLRTEQLTLQERQTVVEVFINVLEGLYAHLIQKRATYGQDQIQQLRALSQRVDSLDQHEFHQAMAEILTGFRDAHTRYIGPTSLHGEVAVLPFLIERYEDDAGTHFVASKVFAGTDAQVAHMAETGFAPGVEITHWNGVQIDIAVDEYADRETGGRRDARQARALESLTLRPLRYALPPLEDWVWVTFKSDDGESEIRLRWLRSSIFDLPKASGETGTNEAAYAIDPVGEASRRAKKMLFSSDAWMTSPERSRSLVSGSDNAVDQLQADDFDDVVLIDEFVGDDGATYGYMRLWSFDMVDDVGFVDHVVAEVGNITQRGLVIDLRGNPGGLIWGAERLLQLFTPDPIEPTRFSMLATDLTRAMARAPQNHHRLGAWRASLETAVVSGEPHSRELPLTPVERCNDIGQRYPGPVVAVVDANTYSAGDLFAAGFVDNGLGTLVAVDRATGAGGANVWDSGQVSRALAGTGIAPVDLPGQIGYTISVRRASRVGERSGMGIEDRGVEAHVQHRLTRRDLESGNADLKSFCAGFLSSEPFTDLGWDFQAGLLSVYPIALDRVEVYRDEEPIDAPRRPGSGDDLTFDVGDQWSTLEVLGFVGAIQRQRRLLTPDRI